MIQKRQGAVFVFILLLNISYCSAQFFPPVHYPKDYFSWPMVATIGLSANFGELRPNHYHMGFDCRTDKTQDLPVLAAADGYVARIKVEPFGFGSSVYINHPNGLTSIYAHLNEFRPDIEKYVKEQQYRLKSWKVDLSIPMNLFPVKREMLIAYSGNTGASQGPHLHFEIRDTRTDKALNPGLFGFDVPDTIPPDMFRLAIYNRALSTYEQSPKFYPLKRSKGIYVPAPPLIIVNTDRISLGIVASDRSSGSNNPNGIYETVLFDNGHSVIGFRLDSISYDETRFFNAHIDYKVRSSGGPYVQHLSGLPGYVNSIYRPANADGIIYLEDSSTHNIRIEVKDTDGNTSVAEFSVKRDPGFIPQPLNSSQALYDPLEFHPGFINVFENSNIVFYLPGNCLYDSMRFRYSEPVVKNGYPVYQLHSAIVPLHSYFPLMIRAQTYMPGKMIIHRFANGRNDYEKAELVKYGKEDGWFRAEFRDLGSFQLMIDTVAPVISPLGFKDGMNCGKLRSLRFVVTDNAGGIKKFIASLDGNWLRFSNDKGRIFVYDFDERCQPGEHELKIMAEDQVGNITEKIYHFTR